MDEAELRDRLARIERKVSVIRVVPWSGREFSLWLRGIRFDRGSARTTGGSRRLRSYVRGLWLGAHQDWSMILAARRQPCQPVSLSPPHQAAPAQATIQCCGSAARHGGSIDEPGSPPDAGIVVVVALVLPWVLTMLPPGIHMRAIATSSVGFDDLAHA
jgi:hypothetical protein